MCILIEIDFVNFSSEQLYKRFGGFSVYCWQYIFLLYFKLRARLPRLSVIQCKIYHLWKAKMIWDTAKGNLTKLCPIMIKLSPEVILWDETASLRVDSNRRRRHHVSRLMTKPTKWPVRPAKTQISLSLRSVWSESSLSAGRKLGSLAIHRTHSEDSDQTWRVPRLIWVVAGRTCHFVGFVMRRLMWFHVVESSHEITHFVCCKISHGVTRWTLLFVSVTTFQQIQRRVW